MSTSIKSLIRIDFFAALPTEISIRILQYFDATTLCKVARVSSLWKRLADDDIIWRRMCQQHINKKYTRCGWSLSLLKGQRQQQWSLPSTEICEVSSTSQLGDRIPSLGMPGNSPLASVDVPCNHDSSANPLAKRRRTLRWKAVYGERHKVGLNWKYGRYKRAVLRGHKDSVMCLQVHGSLLVTGSTMPQSDLWYLDARKLVKTFLGHDSRIRALQFDGNKIVTVAWITKL